MFRTKRFQAKRDQRGVTVVEGALVFPLVMMLVLGIVEGALLFRSHLSATNSATSGSRAGSIDGQSLTADYDILHAVANNASGTSISSIKSIVVYKASDSSSGPTPACIAAADSGNDIGVAGVCNVYNTTDLTRPESDFGPSGFGADQYWPANSRQLSLLSGTDLLGVWVHMTCGCGSSDFFGIAPDLHSVSVTQMEAEYR